MPPRPRSGADADADAEPSRQQLKPIERARRWWGAMVSAKRFVVLPSEAPTPAIARLLRQQHLVMEVAGRRVWILVPERPADRRPVFLANYWAVVRHALTRYEPAAVVGVSAVKLHLGEFSPPAELPLYQAANQSEYALPLESGFTLRLRPRPVPADRIEHLPAPGGVSIPVLGAADLLMTLDEPEIAAGVEPVAAWLRHLVLRTPDLERAATDAPRPVVLQRLADMANELQNRALADQLDAVARQISGHIAPPARTGVGTRIEVPVVLRAQPRGSGSPWLDEQMMRLTRQTSEVATVLGKQPAALPRFAAPKLMGSARESKAYDAYHSTTMEGYRISPEVVEAIVRGEPRPDGPKDEKELAAAMAVQGYSVAFDHVLALARAKTPISGPLILDLYEDLFRPSVDAGVVAPGELRGWRTGSVGLHGWRYVPPNAKKVRDLIDGLEAFADQSELDPVARALLVHLEFVTIHPFMDGNGRLGRLLMNLALLSAGLPWITIRNDERIPFFTSIERAQMDGDTRPFIEFVWHAIRYACADLQRTTERQGRRRRSPGRGGGQ